MENTIDRTDDVTGAQVREYITAMQTADEQVTLSVIFELMGNAGFTQVGMAGTENGETLGYHRRESND